VADRTNGPDDRSTSDARRDRHPDPDADLGTSLRAGAAVYHAGEYHAAHDAWEPAWLGIEEGPDRRLLHGLIQLTAAVHHAETGNAAGATGLAESARGYLDGLGATHRGVGLGPVRSYLDALAADPAEWSPPVRLEVDGTAPTVEGLELTALAVAAGAVAEGADGAVAEGADGAEKGLIADAVRYAREDLADRPTSPLVGLLVGYVRGERRPTVRARLDERVRRRRRRERDVDGLFDADEG